MKLLHPKSIGIPVANDSEWPMQLADAKLIVDSTTKRLPYACGMEDNSDVNAKIKENFAKLIVEAHARGHGVHFGSKPHQRFDSITRTIWKRVECAVARIILRVKALVHFPVVSVTARSDDNPARSIDAEQPPRILRIQPDDLAVLFD